MSLLVWSISFFYWFSRIFSNKCFFAAFSIAEPALDRDRDLAHRFFGPTGLCFEAAAESQINAYSALFGSGIGYVSLHDKTMLSTCGTFVQVFTDFTLADVSYS